MKPETKEKGKTSGVDLTVWHLLFKRIFANFCLVGVLIVVGCIWGLICEINVKSGLMFVTRATTNKEGLSLFEILNVVFLFTC